MVNISRLIRRNNRGGFALPTVLIAAVVMLTVLAVAVSSVASIRTGLKAQYYEQLAKVAGEAGIAYAQACLAKNGNVATWTNAKPLMPNTDCSGTPTSSYTCPGDARCYVMVNENVRSSFSVTAPTTDSDGRAVTLPHTGYVEILRTSTGQVWRTYKQPAVQAAAVPELCSSGAASGLGWSNAVQAASANRRTIAAAPAAQTISISDAAIPAGNLYFKRDFSVSQNGTYTVSALTNSSKDRVEMYVDGSLVTSSQGSLATGSVSLSAGCHTIAAKLTNRTLKPAAAQFTASITQPSSTAALVATDTSWRVSAGIPVGFTNPDYYADPAVWGGTVMAYNPHALISTSGWTVSLDRPAPLIAPSGNNCPASCPGNATVYLRDSKSFYLSSPTEVLVSTICDNGCEVYLDDRLVINKPFIDGLAWTEIVQTTETLPAGFHHVGVRLFNGGTTVNPASVALSVVNKANSQVLARADTTWQASPWATGDLPGNVTAYEASFRPSPKDFIEPVTADILIVGGGGGGGRNAAGGGGAGGVTFLENYALTVRSYTVTVGAGGTGSTSNTVAGGNGGQSRFGDVTVSGGGGGASRDGGNAAASGGSGGGGAGANAAGRVPGGAGTSGQGNNGGAGSTADSGAAANGGGGGGAGGAGLVSVPGSQAGHGGAGRIYYFTGVRLAVGGGGGGGLTTTSSGSQGTGYDGGGNGGTSTTAGTAGTANTGGGGGGGGSSGGTGGSGIVVIRIKSGSATVSASGTYSTATRTIDGTSYVIYTFTANGTFTVSALNPS